MSAANIKFALGRNIICNGTIVTYFKALSSRATEEDLEIFQPEWPVIEQILEK